jgi:hypothetical protein
LAEDTQHFLGCEFFLAIRFPTSNVVRSLSSEQYSGIIIQEFKVLDQTEKVRVFEFLKLFGHVYGFLPLFLVECGYVHTSDQIKFSSLFRVLNKDLSVTLLRIKDIEAPMLQGV